MEQDAGQTEPEGYVIRLMIRTQNGSGIRKRGCSKCGPAFYDKMDVTKMTGEIYVI